jgi:hypothetical protein
MKHTSSTIYYPHENGQVESTNKVIKQLLVKLINDFFILKDEHLSHTIIYAYKMVSKVPTSHTLFELVYGFHPMMVFATHHQFTNFENFAPIRVFLAYHQINWKSWVRQGKRQ